MDSTDADGGYELRHYLRVLWRRKLSIIGPMVVLALLGWLLGSGLTVSHASSVEVLAKPAETTQTATSGGGRSITSVGDEVAILTSDEIEAAVAAEVGHAVAVQVAQKTPDSSVLVLTVTGEQGEVQEDAQAYADTYVELRRGELAEGSTTTMTALTSRLSDIDNQLAQLTTATAALDAQIVAEIDETALRGLNDQRADLLGQRDALSLQRTEVQGQLNDVELAAAVNPTLGIEVLSSATEAELVQGATRSQYASAGLALGLILGVLLAFAREHFDQSVRTTRDVELAGRGVRVLGAIPRHPRGATS